MKIGIDVSQLAYQNTGVANYLENLVFEMVKNTKHEYVLFFSSFRRPIPDSVIKLNSSSNVRFVRKRYPPLVLNMMWNVIHLIPIEHFVGDIDVFITSDWSEPPARKAKKATIIYDLIIYKSPDETDKKIIDVQRKKLSWVKKESDIIFCISKSTKDDAEKILNIDGRKLKVIYPGLTA